MDQLVKFSLLENAIDSLNHAVEHSTRGKESESRDLKIAIKDIAHSMELLLKERLRRVHPAFVWDNVDKYPITPVRSVGTKKALQRLLLIAGIHLSKKVEMTIMHCRKIRDSIEHYEFEIDVKEANAVIGRMLSTVFVFSKVQLNIDLEEEFRSDNRWDSLIKVYEFWVAHGEALEKRLSDGGIPTCECPSCAANTFSLDDSECPLCGHSEEEVECDQCHNMVWASETEYLNIPEMDYESTVCRKCIDEADAADFRYDAWREEQE